MYPEQTTGLISIDAYRARLAGSTKPTKTLEYGGGGPYDPGMESRAAALETHMEYMRAGFAEIKEVQKEALKGIAEVSAVVTKLAGDFQVAEIKRDAQIEKMPSKSDLWAWKFQWLGIALVGFAAIVGGIIGGLDWIKVH